MHNETKFDPHFFKERYTVQVRQGLKMVIVSDIRVQQSRNIGDVKLASKFGNKLGTCDDEILSDDQEEISSHDSKVLDEYCGENDQNQSEMKSKRVVRKPGRFKDMVLYRVYQ